MNLRAIILILAIGIIANGCATKPSGESRNGTGTSPGVGSTNTTQNPIAGLVNFYVEVKLAEIRPGLDLTSGQETEIRKILTRQANGGFEMFSSVVQGMLSSKELDEAFKQRIYFQAQIKSLLTPQQVVRYEELKTARRVRRAREMAADQLQQLQTPLRLKTNQLDSVFTILTKQVETQLSNMETNTTWVLNDRAQFHENTEAFRDVLTPAQFKRFQKLRDQENPSFFQKFWRDLGSAALANSIMAGWR